MNDGKVRLLEAKAMSSSSRMTFWDTAELYIRRWKRYDSYQPRRRICIALLVILVCLLYLGPSVIRWSFGDTTSAVDINRLNIERELRPFLADEARFDASISRSYDFEPGTKNFLAYIANGKFGLSLERDNPFYVLGKRSLELELPYHPTINVDTFGAQSKSALVVRFTDGLVHRITSFSYISKAATITESFYAHRLLSSLLVQEIRIVNPADASLVVRLKRTGWKGKQALKSQSMNVQSHDKTQYNLLQGELPSHDNPRVIGFLIAAPDIPDTVEIPARSAKTLSFRTFVNYTRATPIPELPSKLPVLRSTMREATNKVVNMLSTSLMKYHAEVWSALWRSGFGISVSKAQGALNGDVINATIYYILSQKATFASDIDITSLSELDAAKTNSLLSRPDRCYAGNPTLQAPALWSNLDSFNDVQRIVALWLLTLEKNGCNNLIEAGAEGTLQAVILSFVGMQFHKEHLEMGIHPKELHRDYYIRRVRYNENSLLNITICLGEDNKASIFVALDKNSGKQDFFACDGGCLDSPVQLSLIERQFPVKITEPLTAILYITPNRQHIAELKHAIHVKEVAVAPAHENHIIALHRHGHQLGGLPIFFWITIIFLVVIFHVFLAKLIYNEYCGGSSSGNSRYAV